MTFRPLIWFSGGPLDRDALVLDPDNRLVAEGHGVVLEDIPRPLPPAGTWTPRRGHYVRVGNLALWWGWEGSRPRLAKGQG